MRLHKMVLSMQGFSAVSLEFNLRLVQKFIFGLYLTHFDPASPIIFEGRNLSQQTIYHWQGNSSKSPIHFRYRQNILISPLYDRFSRNDSAMAPDKKFRLLKYEHIIYHFKAHDLGIPLI